MCILNIFEYVMIFFIVSVAGWWRIFYIKKKICETNIFVSLIIQIIFFEYTNIEIKMLFERI